MADQDGQEALLSAWWVGTVDRLPAGLAYCPLTLPGAENIARNAWEKLPLLSQYCGQFAERPGNKKV
jgi:hypothetical protein